MTQVPFENAPCAEGVAVLVANGEIKDFAARYERAMTFETSKLLAKVRNFNLHPSWVGQEDRFWIRNETHEGHQFLAVDAPTASKERAFDHAKLASFLTAQGFSDVKDTALPLQDLRITRDGFSFNVEKRRFSCASDGACNEIAPQSPLEVFAPGGKRKAYVENFNVCIADADASGARQLTADGVDGYAYGETATPDRENVPRRRGDIPRPLKGLVWSPDGRYLLAVKADLRAVPLRPFVTEHVAADQNFAITHMRRHLVSADKTPPSRRIAIIDTETGKSVFAEIPQEDFQNFAVIHFERGILWWAPGKAYIVAETYDSRTFGIYEVDLQSGAARKIIEEKERFYYDYNPDDYQAPNFHVTSDGKELIWYSQRTGYGHLYLFDVASGQLKNAVTEGEWVVFNLIRVDEKARRLFFTAGGIDAGKNPYHAKLYSIGFDGADMKTLTPENANHIYTRNALTPAQSPSQFSPSGKYFVDVSSTNETPPRMVVRSSDGELVGEVARADATELFAMDWQPAERFVVKAADGETDLWGVMYKPSSFDPNERYPVIDHMYPGPQGSYGANSFLLGSHIAVNSQALAELGFIVVNVDGRGTSHRGKKFRYAFAGTEDVFGAVDHMAAIQNLAKQRPYVDATRVGVKGGSFGGYGSTRAFLLYPDFFTVNVSYVGPHDYRYLHVPLSNERFFMNEDDPEKVDANYELVSNTRLVDRIKGKLFLIWGEIDENVPLNNAFVMLQALLDADAEFDSLIVPNQPHHIQHPAVLKKEFKYFYDHLGPPA